ncbi:MAG: hypothetical protein WBM17_16140, partial [Anaerolineales bacterium]
MSPAAPPEHFTTREHRAVQLLCCLVIFTVALRRVAELNEASSIALALAFLGLFTFLFASESRLSCRFPWYPRVYFTLQFLLAQLLGLFQSYQDTWALLYTVLGIQAAYRCSRRGALVLAGLFVGSTVITQSIEFGLLSGIGRASAFIIIGLFITLYDNQYSQKEDAHSESRVLLEE